MENEVFNDGSGLNFFGAGPREYPQNDNQFETKAQIGEKPKADQEKLGDNKQA